MWLTKCCKGSSGTGSTKGEKGDAGSPGLIGPKGALGQKGVMGDKGNMGDTGSPGSIGQTGPKGAIGQKGVMGDKGNTGDTGSPGSTGPTGPKGAPGQKGMKGDEKNGGTVYVRWGHNQCPSTAQPVYSGRAGGSHFSHPGSGSNPQCLPLDPNFLRSISGNQYRALMYGAEYESHTDSNSHVHGRQNTDVPCAVCHVSDRTAVYMVPAKYTCPTGWTREYYGYLMAEQHVGGHHRSQFTCVDNAFKSVTGSSANKGGLLFYFVEGRCGSLPCPPYDNTKELSCAVCTK